MSGGEEGYSDIYLRRVPLDLKCHFKAWCSRRGTNMTAALRKFMSECTKGDKSVLNSNRISKTEDPL